MDDTHAAGGLVTFEPRARTAWHTYPAGQTLIVTATNGMRHIAITNVRNGGNVEWLEHASDAEYTGQSCGL